MTISPDVLPVRRSSVKYGTEDRNILLDDFLLDDLHCNGREDNLLQCGRSRGHHDCTVEENAGVKCGGKSAWGIQLEDFDILHCDHKMQLFVKTSVPE